MAPLKAFITLLMVKIATFDGCDKTYTAESGIIRSPRVSDSDSRYPNSADCTYTIRGSSRFTAVEFMFEKFKTIGGYDFVHIGKDKLSGSSPKGKTRSYTFNNTLTVRFTSTDAVNREGFIIKYRLSPECPLGHYGVNCTEECSDGCQKDTCSRMEGSCECRPGLKGNKCDTECRDNNYGLNCTSTCSTGCSDVCNKQTGKCTCKPGKTGTHCNIACPPGTYDSYCAKSCSPGCVDGSCSKEDGKCSCKPGFKGNLCSRNCSSQNYGPDCTETCSIGCRRRRCDRVNGSCECLSGWTGAKCNQRCLPGRYGLNCKESCNPGCSDTCSSVDGTCTCRAGWEGEKCESECPANRHGVDCESRCSSGCVEGACHSESGNCTCLAGWEGDQCLHDCGNGTFGDSCKETCSFGCVDTTCNKVDGTCSCISGYQGERCTYNVGLIAGVPVGFLLALLISASVFFIYKRIKKSRQEAILRKTTTINDVLSMKDIPPGLAEGNAYVEYDEESVYVDPFDEEETEYENVNYSCQQKSVPMTARRPAQAEQETTYGNVQCCGTNKRDKKPVVFGVPLAVKDDLEEDADYQNISSLRKGTKRRK